MCVVNVHWKLGTEHYSENGCGPGSEDEQAAFFDELANEESSPKKGHHYDESNPIITTPYEWKHCIGMEEGETLQPLRKVCLSISLDLTTLDQIYSNK